MFRLKHVNRAVLALCAGGAAFGAVAQQQQQPQTLERIEITGSNIKRTSVETAAPVTIITREDMVRSGATTLADVLTKLTLAQGSLSGAEFSGFSPGAATISLRGLGAGATLILINGRRIAPYGITGFQEILTSVNSIPVSAIDRIDILKDGASAIYGSEAIAGVVNIILRRDYTGLETQFRTNYNQGGAFKSNQFVLNGGYGDITKDRFNVFGTYEHFEQDGMLVSENRFFPSRNLVSLTGNAATDFRSSYSYPGNFLTGVIRTLPGCDPKNQRLVGTNTRCVLDVFDYNTSAPKVSRDSLMSRGTLEINSTLSAFAELGYSKGKYGYQFDPQFYYNNFATQTLDMPGTAFGQAGRVSLLYRAGDLGPRRFTVESDESRLLAGLKGSVGGWDFDSAIGNMGNKVSVRNRGNILIDPMEAALANGTYVPGGVNSPNVLAAISPELVRRGKATTNFIDARVSTEFGALNLPGGPVGFAAGVDYRKEKQKDNNDPAFVNGDVFGFGSLDALDASQTVKSVFAEFNLPILKTLEAQIAARHDRYSVAGTSTTPKVGLKWTALPTLVVRGTYAEGFRAPNFRETSPAVSVGFYNGQQDPVRCPTIVTTNADCSLSIQANISGNAQLKAEKAKSYTLGLVFEPLKDVSVSVDFWRIKRNDEITNLDISYLLANQAAFSQFIRRDAAGSITNVDLPYVNLAGTTVQGLDLDLRAKMNLGENGKLGFGAAGTYYDKFLVTPAPGAAEENYNGTYGQPRWRATARVNWEKGPWLTELQFNHVNGYLNKPTPSGVCSAPAALTQYCEVGAWDTFSLFVSYKGFKNLDIGLNIDNLMDAAPPFDYRAAVNSQTRAWSAQYHNAYGRVYSLRLNYKFW
jgi:iron complex outermembrane recepter protein